MAKVKAPNRVQRTVLKTLVRSSKPLTPEEVYKKLRKTDPKLGLGKVTEACQWLRSEGLTTRQAETADGDPATGPAEQQVYSSTSFGDKLVAFADAEVREAQLSDSR